MKHKLEYWKYTPFEYEEATDHLNEMAAKGWALQDITTIFLTVACYEKSETAASYRYTAEVVSELEDEELCLLCRDAGWERVLQLEDGLWIFRTKDRAAKPLFGDGSQRREAAWENLYNNSAKPFYMLFAALICFAIGMVLLVGSWNNSHKPWHSITMVYLMVTFGLIIMPIEIANLLWLKRGSLGRKTFVTGAKPGWLRKLAAAEGYLILFYMIGVILIRVIEYAAAGNWIGALSMALCPAAFLTGALIYLIGKQKMAGRCLMILAAVIFIARIGSTEGM